MNGKSISEQIKEQAIKERVESNILKKHGKNKTLEHSSGTPCKNGSQCSVFRDVKANGKCPICGKVKFL